MCNRDQSTLEANIQRQITDLTMQLLIKQRSMRKQNHYRKKHKNMQHKMKKNNYSNNITPINTVIHINMPNIGKNKKKNRIRSLDIESLMKIQHLSNVSIQQSIFFILVF